MLKLEHIKKAKDLLSVPNALKIVTPKTPNDMSNKEFFRAEYRTIMDSDVFEGVIPTVWIGNQGFELNVQYGEEGMTAQQHAEWFVSMFKKAIDNYAEQHFEDVLGEIKSRDELVRSAEHYAQSQMPSNYSSQVDYLEFEQTKCEFILKYFYTALNLLKQRKG